jgi:hypothetical protein
MRHHRPLSRLPQPAISSFSILKDFLTIFIDVILAGLRRIF